MLAWWNDIKGVALKWAVGAVLTFLVAWFVKVQLTVENQPEIMRKLEAQAAVQDDVLTEIQFVRSNMVTHREFKFYFDQHRAEHNEMWRGIELARHVPVTHRDRPRYYEQYGPIPETMTDWFEVYLNRGNGH